MRTIIAVLFWILVSIISIPLYLVELVVRCFSRDLEYKIAHWVTVTAFKVWLFIAGTKLTVTGMEKIPKDVKAMQFVSNHRGFFDIIALTSVLPVPHKKNTKKVFFEFNSFLIVLILFRKHHKKF